MLYPRLNDLNMVQEPSRFLSFALCPPPFLGSTGPGQLVTCASCHCLRPCVLLARSPCPADSGSEEPRTHQEMGCDTRSPPLLCALSWPAAEMDVLQRGCLAGQTTTQTGSLNPKLPKVMCLPVCSCIIKAV